MLRLEWRTGSYFGISRDFSKSFHAVWRNGMPHAGMRLYLSHYLGMHIVLNSQYS